MSPDSFTSPFPVLVKQTEDPTKWFAANITTLHRHRIAAVLAHALSSQGYASSDIEETIITARARLTVYNKALGMIAENLDENKIRYAVLKGASLWEFYPEDWLRDQEDIDLLIDEASAETVIRILDSFGYTPVYLTDTAKHLPLKNSGNEFPDLELHFRITPAGRGYRKTRELLETASVIEQRGIQFPVLKFEDRLRHGIMHAANHRVMQRLLWLNDIRHMAESGNNTDWVLNLRGQERRMVECVMFYTSVVTGSEKTASILENLRPGPFFLKLTRRLIPPHLVLDNPILHSRIRRTLYILNLVRNPLDLFRILRGKLREK